MEEENSWDFYGADFTLTDVTLHPHSISSVDSLFDNSIMTLNHVFFIKFMGADRVFGLKYSILTLKYNIATKLFDSYSLNNFFSPDDIALVQYPTSFGINLEFESIDNILNIAGIKKMTINSSYFDADSWAIINGVNEGDISSWLKENLMLEQGFKQKVKEIITKQIKKLENDRKIAIKSIVKISKMNNWDPLVAQEIASFSAAMDRPSKKKIHDNVGGKRKNTKRDKRKKTKKIRRTRKRTY